MKTMEENLFGICPVCTAQKIIGGKWSVLVLYYLSSGTMRFSELQRMMPSLTQATLTKQLRSLEEYGLVLRTVYPQVPPRVEYSLTGIGRQFIPVLNAIYQWGEEYKVFLNARKA
jgi:Predicted transcriptional regulators